MTATRKLVRATITPVGDDEVDVVMSTDALARDGHILLPQGCVLENYRSNPITLWSHDPDHPVGNAENVVVGPDQLVARVRFAPLGISRKADEVRGLTKAGVIRAVSVGFDPIETEPLDPKKPRGGQRIKTWELLELSFVSVPADPGAVVTARSNGETPMATDAGATAQRQTKVHARGGGPIVFKRGLYQVASLAYLFEELGRHVDMAKWESTIEGDASKVPSMLASILHDLGDALLAMTQEEISEALAGFDLEPDEADDDGDEILVVEERKLIAAATSPRVRAFRRGIAHAKLRAGKTLSAETARCLRDAKAMHEEGLESCRSAMRSHKAGMAAIDGLMDRSGVSEEDGDAKDVQTSDGVTGGTSDDEGARAFDYRRRQTQLLALTAA